MGLFFVYILKSTVCLAIFYLFYKLLLSRETFHSFNRFALMGILLLSVLLPFSETLFHNAETMQTASMGVAESEDAATASPIYEVSTAMEEEKNNYLIIALFSMYGLGILFFAGRNIYSFIQLIGVTRQGPKEDFRHYFAKEDQQKPLLQSKASYLV